MNYTFNIQSPIIVTGQYFRVRYRKLPAGSFGSYADYSFNTFTITGLTAGEYEIEFVFFNGTVECPPERGFFTVESTPSCFSFTSSVKKTTGGTYFVELSWTGSTFPNCGYKVFWQQGAASGTVNLSSGTSPLNITVPTSANVSLVVDADDCNGNKRNCYTGTAVFAGSPCSPMSINDYSVSQINDITFTITLFLTNSNPFTISSLLTYMQTGAVAGTTPATGSSTVAITPIASPTVSFTVTVQAGSYVGIRPTFVVNLTDKCGNVVTFNV